MEKVVGLFKPKVSPQEQLREWQRKLRQESRNVDRQIRGMMASTLVFSFPACLSAFQFWSC